VLPVLLEKTLERGWRAVVETISVEHARALDQALWSYRDDSFLPHGLVGEGSEADQPVLLTDGEGNANAAQVRFYVGGAVPRDVGGYERLVFIFNGHDPDAVTTARVAWRALAPANAVTYWQQDANGRWVKKA
jgi:DNA polymerase-3 subunit chi